MILNSLDFFSLRAGLCTFSHIISVIRYIYLEDIMRFMREDEALKTIRLFEDGSEQKGISKRALKNWVVSNIVLPFLLEFVSSMIVKRVCVSTYTL